MAAKLADKAGQSRHLQQQTEDLETARRVLRKVDLDPRGREPGGLLSEVELLRRRVEEMEGKDEELLRLREQCRELERRMATEAGLCHGLKAQVEQLNARISSLDRMEEALGRNKDDCCSLRSSLEREKEACRALSAQMDSLKLRLGELEASEGTLEESEAAIRQELNKLRSLTAVLVEDRRMMTQRLQQAEEKLSRTNKNQQTNVLQQELRSRAQLEEKIKTVTEEKEQFRARLSREEERNAELQAKMTTMRKRLQVLENKRETEEKYVHSSNSHHVHQPQENKVRELTLELEKLQRRLQDKEMLERELMRVEEDFESLERSFHDEQEKSKDLMKELEVARKELCGYQQAEKQEVDQEHLLLCRLQKEQVRSRLLGREVATLKEKLQQLMGTEENISRVQLDHHTLQGKLSLQEARNQDLAQEIRELSRELNRYRRLGDQVPGTHVDPHQTSREVQTDMDYRTQLPPGRTLHEDQEEDPNHNVDHRRCSNLVSNLNSLNTANDLVSQSANGEVMTLMHTPGQPLHIKVTPHHVLNTAMLEISSPTADPAASFTSTAIIPASLAPPPKQRITIIQNSPRSPASSPDRAVSLLNGTPVSLSPPSSRSATPDHIQILTVQTCSTEPPEVTGQTVFCKTPERQNSWPKSNESSPSIVATEDNKIHIHLGSPYLPPLAGPYFLRHEQRTQVLANSCQVKGVGKVTSSITISPTSTLVSPNNEWPL